MNPLSLLLRGLPLRESGGGAPAWTPASLTGLQLWVQAGQGLYQDSARTTPAAADNDPVGGWADLSGLGNHYSQGTSAKRPALRLAWWNGRPMVVMDAVDDALITALDVPAPWTIYVVEKPVSILTSTSIRTINDAVGVRIRCASVARPAVVGNNAYLQGAVSNHTEANTNIHRFRFGCNGVSAAYAVDGVDYTLANAFNFGINPSLGAGNTTYPEPANTAVGEVIVLDHTASGAEEAQIAAYFTSIWGTV